jgi:cbb3-type cytochrome oxidase cytochrome c subunit
MKMKATNFENMKSLLSTLSAVRATLNDEEQALLDSFILGEAVAHARASKMEKAQLPDADEVVAHARASKMEKAQLPDADEVVAHARASKMEKAQLPDADEVVAHARASKMEKAQLPDADEVVAHAMPFAITFDPEVEAYLIKAKS